MISFAWLSPCICTRYFQINSTRWSLKVPLITWCSKSSDIISWISAHGKSFVKGYNENNYNSSLECIYMTYHNVIVNSVLIPQHIRWKRVAQQVCEGMCSPATDSSIKIICICSTSSKLVRCTVYTMLLVAGKLSWWIEYSLCTPSLNYPSKDDLLRIIGNEGPKVIDDPTKVPIRTSTDHRLCHGHLERLKNGTERGME